MAEPNRLEGSSPHPRVLFTREQIETIRARLKTPKVQAGWKRLIKLCEKSKQPKSGATHFLEAVSSNELKQAEIYIGHALRAAYYNALVYVISESQEHGRAASLLLVKLVKVYPDQKLDWEEGPLSMASFALAYDWAFSMLGPNEAAEIRAFLVQACRRSHESWLDTWSGYSSVLNGSRYDTVWPQRAARLGLASLAIEDETPEYDSDWLRTASRIVSKHIQGGLTAEGALYADASYVFFGMDEIAQFMAGLFLREEDYFKHSLLGKIPEWLLYETNPWPYETGYGYHTQSGLGAGSFLTLLAAKFGGLAHELLKRTYQFDKGLGIEPDPLALLLWYQPPKYKTPDVSRLPLDRYFSARGLIYFRSGWGPDDIAIHIQADPIAGFGAVGNQGSFTLYRGGAYLVINVDHIEKSPLAYNGVFIDGLSQAAGKDGDSESVIRGYLSTPLAALAHIDLKPAYDYLIRRSPQTGQPVYEKFNPVKYAERSFMFIRGELPPYLVLVDDIQKDLDERNYDWLLHTAQGSEVVYEENRLEIVDSFDGDYLACPRGSEGGLVKFEFRNPGKATFWGWMLLRGTMPIASKEQELSSKILERHAIAPHPTASSWTWKRIPFYKDLRRGIRLARGHHDLILQGNDGAWVAKCLLTKSSEYQPSGMNPEPPSGSVWITPKNATRIVSPWHLVKGNARRPSLNIIFAEPDLFILNKGKMPGHKEYPVIRSTTKGQRGRFSAVLIPGGKNILKPTVQSLTKGDWGASLEVHWPQQKSGQNTIDFLSFSAGRVTIQDREPIKKEITQTDANVLIVPSTAVESAPFESQEGDTKGAVQTDAKIAFYRFIEDEEEELGPFVFVKGNYLEFEGTRLVEGVGPPFSLSSDGETVYIDAPGIKKLKILMPNPRRVVLNGRDVSFTIDEEDYVYPRINTTVIPESME